MRLEVRAARDRARRRRPRGRARRPRRRRSRPRRDREAHQLLPEDAPAMRAALHLARRRSRDLVERGGSTSGTLNAARCSRQWSARSRSLGGSRAATTAAPTTSPYFASGIPNDRRVGHGRMRAAARASTSSGEMFSPPRMIISLMPPDEAQVAVRRRRPRSPVRNQPSRRTPAFASGFAEVARRHARAADRRPRPPLPPGRRAVGVDDADLGAGRDAHRARRGAPPAAAGSRPSRGSPRSCRTPRAAARRRPPRRPCQQLGRERGASTSARSAAAAGRPAGRRARAACGGASGSPSTRSPVRRRACSPEAARRDAARDDDGAACERAAASVEATRPCTWKSGIAQ